MACSISTSSIINLFSWISLRILAILKMGSSRSGTCFKMISWRWMKFSGTIGAIKAWPLHLHLVMSCIILCRSVSTPDVSCVQSSTTWILTWGKPGPAQTLRARSLISFSQRSTWSLGILSLWVPTSMTDASGACAFMSSSHGLSASISLTPLLTS